MSQREQDQLTRISIADPDVSNTAQGRVAGVLSRGDLADGDEVRAFESEFADYCEVEHGVATANGTAALHAALAACGIGEGDTVLTTPFSFVATANAVRFCGAEPVFADVERETFNLDPDAVREAIRERDGDVDAILPVHLYGLPAEMEELAAIADEYDAALIEDAAQAHGARYDGEPVGSFGDAATFSFYPTKNMTTGEGGMIVTDRDDVAERAAQFINHGRDDEYRHASLGHNFRMTNVAAAIGRTQLERLPGFVRARRDHAAYIANALADSPLRPQADPAHVDHAYHQYTVACDDREALREHLDERGIDTAVYYPTPIHEQPAYDHVDATAPNAEWAAEHVISVPIHPELTEEELDRVAAALASYDPRD